MREQDAPFASATGSFLPNLGTLRDAHANTFDGLNKMEISPTVGTIAIVHQPRKPGATDEDTEVAGNRFMKVLQEAGFKEIRVEMRIMKPVSAICLLGMNK